MEPAWRGVDPLSPGEALVGRQHECEQISALLSRARNQRSGALVLRGEPGVGKSALAAWALAQARDMRVLTAHGVESEMDLPFAGLSELFAGEFERFDELPGPQAAALDAALARGGAPAADRFAIGAAVLSLLAGVGGRRSVLVVVDDAHWVDAASAEALVFAARRLRSEGVAMLLVTRPGGRFDADGHPFPQLTVEGLGRSAAHLLLDKVHGTMSDRVAELLTERTHGNPLALIEIPRMLSAAQLAGEEPIADPLPVGPALVRALLTRLAGLSADTRAALLLAAASGDERVQPVVDALETRGIGRSVLDAAERAGILTVDGDSFEFRHPLLREAIYHDADGPAQRAAHAALARVIGGESRAWHLAQATVGSDETVADALEEVALEARRRGAPAAAAAAFERAARHSEDEAARGRRLVEAARDAYVAGAAKRALELLGQARINRHDAARRAEIEQLRGRILVTLGRTEVAYQVLVTEGERARDVDPARAATMLAEACVDRALRADVDGAIAVGRKALGIATDDGEGVQTHVATVLASILALNGQRDEARRLLDPLLAPPGTAEPSGKGGQVTWPAAQACLWLERHAAAADLLDQLIATARTASAPTALLMPLSCRADLDMRLGRWDVAAAQAHEAAHLGDEVSQYAFAAYPLETLARIAAATGDEAGSRRHAERALALIDVHHNELGRLYVESALGLLELAQGRMTPAIGHLEHAQALAEAHGILEPSVVQWEADLVEAYVRAGEAPKAEAALAVFERRAERTGGRWAAGTAARCRVLLCDDAEIDFWFESALAQLEAVTARFDIARTHLCRGERLRRAARRADARRSLRSAIEQFEALGATPWRERAQIELRATGATLRRRRDDGDGDALTAHEIQVARVIVGGATNREAAAALFLSPKTIEFHLGHIYRKLGVRTRTELAAMAARRGWLDDGGSEPSLAVRRGRHD